MTHQNTGLVSLHLLQVKRDAVKESKSEDKSGVCIEANGLIGLSAVSNRVVALARWSGSNLCIH